MSKYPHVKAECARQGRTLASLAEPVGVTVNSLYTTLKSGTAWPALRSSIAAELGVDEAELFSESDPVRARVAAERAAQGLPVTITDPATLSLVATVLRGGGSR